MENLLYFQTAQDHEEDDIYQDIAEPEDEIMPIRTKHASENDNDADLFSTAESSQNDATDGDIVEMTETRVEVIDEEMKEVMEKLDQDLHKIVQMSDEIERAMAVNEHSMQQDEPVNEEIPMEREELAEESKELYVTDEIEDIEELIKEPEVNDEEMYEALLQKKQDRRAVRVTLLIL